jgi:hypothetical protein
MVKRISPSSRAMNFLTTWQASYKRVIRKVSSPLEVPGRAQQFTSLQNGVWAGRSVVDGTLLPAVQLVQGPVHAAERTHRNEVNSPPFQAQCTLGGSLWNAAYLKHTKCVLMGSSTLSSCCECRHSTVSNRLKAAYASQATAPPTGQPPPRCCASLPAATSRNTPRHNFKKPKLHPSPASPRRLPRGTARSPPASWSWSW